MKKCSQPNLIHISKFLSVSKIDERLSHSPTLSSTSLPSIWEQPQDAIITAAKEPSKAYLPVSWVVDFN